jgi:hypothetical protein
MPVRVGGEIISRGKIFISYRRDDDPGFAQALYLRLEQEFGGENLFMDVEGHIRPGDDFVTVLNDQLAACNVLLAIIGKRWLDARDERGNLRLEKKDDFVRIEIATALQLGKKVIPVLVNEAKMPAADRLPEPLKPLARRNAVAIRQSRFGDDSKGLIDALKGQAAASGGDVAGGSQKGGSGLNYLMVTLVLMGLVGAVLILTGPGTQKQPPLTVSNEQQTPNPPKQIDTGREGIISPESAQRFDSHKVKLSVSNPMLEAMIRQWFEGAKTDLQPQGTGAEEKSVAYILSVEADPQERVFSADCNSRWKYVWNLRFVIVTKTGTGKKQVGEAAEGACWDSRANDELKRDALRRASQAMMEKVSVLLGG